MSGYSPIGIQIELGARRGSAAELRARVMVSIGAWLRTNGIEAERAGAHVFRIGPAWARKTLAVRCAFGADARYLMVPLELLMATDSQLWLGTRLDLRSGEISIIGWASREAIYQAATIRGVWRSGHAVKALNFQRLRSVDELLDELRA